MPQSTGKRALTAKHRALRFENRADLLAALDVLDELEAVYPIQYAVLAASLIVVVPTHSFRKVAALLAERELPFTEPKVVPLNTLSPEEQAKRRGLLRNRSFQ